MNFQHTEDRRMLADSVNRFIAEQYPVEKRDPMVPSSTGFDLRIWQEFADLGMIGALFSETDGGFGGSGFDIAVVFEAVGKGLVVEPLLGALMAGQTIARAGSDAQKGLLARIVDGSVIAALAHDEADAGHDPARVHLHAERSGTGWRLQGVKAAVPQAEQASHFVVSARTSNAEDDPHGISLFLVPAGTPGLTVRGCAAIDGGRVGEVTLDGVQLPEDALLGPENGGYEALQAALEYGLLALAAESLGAMEVAKAATLDYLAVRKQFGVAIGSFQALQHRMANLLLEIEQARSAVINAAAALDGAADARVRQRVLAAAKYTVGQVGQLVAEEAVQMHGGIGMTWELPLAHYAKRLVMIEHQLGDRDHHLQRYIALGREGA